MFTGTPAPSSHDIDAQIMERFRQAAKSPQGLFAYPTGLEGLRLLGYPEEDLAALPAAVTGTYCGVGNPFSAGLPAKGESVLDVGCGTGVDALVAARRVGPHGRVEGLEFSPDMLERARANAQDAGLANAAFRQGRAEQLPYADAGFDLFISNGVYNLVPDKPRALAEAWRVLKPGGRLQVADQILEAEEFAACPLPQPGALTGNTPGSWAR